MNVQFNIIEDFKANGVLNPIRDISTIQGEKW